MGTQTETLRLVIDATGTQDAASAIGSIGSKAKDSQTKVDNVAGAVHGLFSGLDELANWAGFDFNSDEAIGAFDAVTTAAGKTDTAVGKIKTTARGVGSGIVAGLGGPVGVVMAGLGLAWDVFNATLESANGKVKDFAISYQGLVQGGADPALALARSAQGLADSWSFLEQSVKIFTSGGQLPVDAAAADIEAYRQAVGAAALDTDALNLATRNLKDAIAGQTDNVGTFANAVAVAGQASVSAANNQTIYNNAIAAYTASTVGAVDATFALIGATLQQQGGLLGVQSAIQAVNDTSDNPNTAFYDESAAAALRLQQSVLSYAQSSADTAVQAATDSGQILSAWDEAALRADTAIAAMQTALNQPGLTDDAKAQIQGMIDKIQTAKDTAAGDPAKVTAVLEGDDKVKTDTEALTGDKGDATVNVKTSGTAEAQAAIQAVASKSYPATINVALSGAGSAFATLVDIANGPYNATIFVRQQAVGAPVVPGQPPGFRSVGGAAPAALLGAPAGRSTAVVALPSGGGVGQVVNITVNGALDAQGVARKVADVLRKQQRRTGSGVVVTTAGMSP